MSQRLNRAVAAVCQQRWLQADLEHRVGTIAWNGHKGDLASWRDFIGQPWLELMEAAEEAGVWTAPVNDIFA